MYTIETRCKGLGRRYDLGENDNIGDENSSSNDITSEESPATANANNIETKELKLENSTMTTKQPCCNNTGEIIADPQV